MWCWSMREGITFSIDIDALFTLWKSPPSKLKENDEIIPIQP